MIPFFKIFTFCRCILDFLKPKATILVTHQIQFLQKATRILVLKDGKTIACGTFNELVNSKIDFISLLAVKKETDKKQGDNPVNEIKRMIRSVSMMSTSSIASSHADDNELRYFEDELDEDEEKSKQDEPKLKEETKMTGSIESSIYWEYIRAGAGFFLMTITISTMIMSQVLFHGSDYFLSYW